MKKIIWEKSELLVYSLQSFLLLACSLFTRVKISLRVFLARVSQATHAILLARNNRIYAGVLILIVSPVFEIIYKLFRESINVNSYWDSYYFLYAVGPHLTAIATLTGVFFLFSPSNRLRYALIIPSAYKFGKIIWLASISTNADFHRIVPGSFVLIGVSVALVWFLVFDWLMSLHFHKKEGTVARIIGILTAPNINKELAYDIAHREAIKKLELDKI